MFIRTVRVCVLHVTAAVVAWEYSVWCRMHVCEGVASLVPRFLPSFYVTESWGGAWELGWV